jgi:hypothetical protein
VPLDKSQKEIEIEAGQLADLQEEVTEFQKEYKIDDLILGMHHTVDPIMLAIQQTGQHVEVLVCCDVHKDPAWWVAKHHGLTLIVAPFFPEDEIFVTTFDKVEKLIRSRVDKDSTERRILVPKGGFDIERFT